MIKKIFLAAPISGFEDKDEYINYREKVMTLLHCIQGKYKVYCEIERLDNKCAYDSPGKSVREDFSAISQSDIFILVHPKRMQTSSLIELGYACQNHKKIIMIGKKENLPYLALGLSEGGINSVHIDADITEKETVYSLMKILEEQ